MKLRYPLQRGELECLKRRFWSKVQAIREPDSCWLWNASTSTGGYGMFKFRIRLEATHRISWLLAHGEVPPDGLFVLHKCDNRRCVNPNHLFLGTHTDNMRDMFAKGRDNHPTGESHGGCKLSDAQVAEIRELYLKGNVTHRQLGLRFNVAHSQIGFIVRHEQRTNQTPQLTQV